MSVMLVTTACISLVASAALGFDAAETEQVRLESVNVLTVLSDWGNVGPSPADVNGDGIVNVDDLLMVISAWGPCVE